MNNNKTLTILVVVLALALVAETVYIWNAEKNKISRKSLFGQRATNAQKLSQFAKRNLNKKSSNFGMPNMPVQPTDPFREMEKVQRQMDRMFQDGFPQSASGLNMNLASANRLMSLQTDIKKTDNAYIIQMDVPGMKKEEINIDIQGNMLTISGQRNQEVKQEEKAAGFVSQEREFGFFSRSLLLPPDVKKEGIKAACENGVLSVTFPRVAVEKPAPEQPTKIKVE